MPRDVPLGTIMRVKPRGVLERPECAKLMGAIVAEWSLLEASLAATYCELAYGPDPQGLNSTGHWIAMQTFEIVQTARQKRSILIGAAEKRGLDAQVLSELKALLKRFQNLAQKRVDSAHGRWMISDAYPNGLILFRNAGKMDEAQIYDVKDFQQTLDDITRLGSEMETFHHTIIRPRLERR